MSEAGILSNQGDEYQIINAVEIMINILKDAKGIYEKMEIDSSSLENGRLIAVDDVVVYKTNDTKTCYQYKKNEKSHKYWTVSTLRDELVKAQESFSHNPTNEYIFASRTPFGDLKRIQEKTDIYYDSEAFVNELPRTLSKTYSELETIFGDKLFAFLQSSKFEQTQEYLQIEKRCTERLESFVTNASLAYAVLFKEAHQLWSKTTQENNVSIKNRHFVTKQILLNLFEQQGITLLTKKINKQELTDTFNQLSSIGTDWRRDINGKKVALKTIDELIQEITVSSRDTIVLTGEPGAGKTCILLELKDRIPQMLDNTFTIFIQARSFEKCTDSTDLINSGLPNNFVEKIAQMAIHKKIILLIDSLDVLSITKNHNIFGYFLSLIDQIKNIDNIISIIACREFDYHYDYNLANKNWKNIHASPLDWLTEIKPLLSELQLPTDIDKTTQNILKNPLYLSLYVEMANRNETNIRSSQFLIHEYIDHCFKHLINDDELQNSAQIIANQMLQNRSISINKSRLRIPTNHLSLLLSHGLLQESVDTKDITFRHQVFLDAFNIREALKKNLTLKQFINNLLPTPFIRPTVKEYTLYLSNYERNELTKQLRAVITDEKIAYHLKRLIIEVYATLEPIDSDWSFIKFLKTNHLNLFHILYWPNKQEAWFFFWEKYIAIPAINANNQHEILVHSQYLHDWWNIFPKECLEFWNLSLQLIVDEELRERLISSLYFPLSKFKSTPENSAFQLVSQLLLEKIDSYTMGEIICQLIRSANTHEHFLYDFIFQDIKLSNIKTPYLLNDKVKYGNRYFSDTNFCSSILHNSTNLLDKILRILECASIYGVRKYAEFKCYYGFLSYSSHNHLRSHRETHYPDPISSLLKDIENSLTVHIKNDTEWWKTNQQTLLKSKNLFVFYCITQALLQKISGDLDIVCSLLTNLELLRSDISYELSLLLYQNFLQLNEEQQNQIITAIQQFTLYHDLPNDYEEKKLKVLYIWAIPANFRLGWMQDYLDEYYKGKGIFNNTPDITSSFGVIQSPIAVETILQLSNPSLITAVKFYEEVEFSIELIGGRTQVASTLCDASVQTPKKFIDLLSSQELIDGKNTSWDLLHTQYKNSILRGISYNILYRKEKIRPSNLDIATLSIIEDQELLSLIKAELNNHMEYWLTTREFGDILCACSLLITNEQDVTTLVQIIKNYTMPIGKITENVELHALNSPEGKLAEALSNMALFLSQKHIALPAILDQELKEYAKYSSATQYMLLRNLHVLQYYNPTLGWHLFDIIIKNSHEKVWKYSERCLYHAYSTEFQKVDHYLTLLSATATSPEFFKSWGRIMALSQLNNHIQLDDLLTKIQHTGQSASWSGAMEVWGYNYNIAKYQYSCSSAILFYLNQPIPSLQIISKLTFDLLHENHSIIPLDLLDKIFKLYKSQEKNPISSIDQLNDWLAKHLENPIYIFEVLKIVISYIKDDNTYIYSFKNLPIFLTAIFKEAEERELEDDGKMLKDVIEIQDEFYKGNSLLDIDKWLTKAER